MPGTIPAPGISAIHTLRYLLLIWLAYTPVRALLPASRQYTISG